MKKILFILAATTLIACTSQTKSGEESAEGTTPAAEPEWVVVTLNVEGMTCDGCENAIKAGVESLDGIGEVESSHEEAWTRVKFDRNATSVEEISAKITETGYEVKGEAAEGV